MPNLAKKIVVDHEQHTIEIDDHQFNFHISEEGPLVRLLPNGMWAVAVEILADEVEQVLLVKDDDTADALAAAKAAQAERHKKLIQS